MADLLNPQSYLQTEARIISCDDIHVTLAVRLERAMISRYLPFMEALKQLPIKSVKDVELI